MYHVKYLKPANGKEAGDTGVLEKSLFVTLRDQGTVVEVDPNAPEPPAKPYKAPAPAAAPAPTPKAAPAKKAPATRKAKPAKKKG